MWRKVCADELFAGELERTKHLIRALPGALDMPNHVVETAVAETMKESDLMGVLVEAGGSRKAA
jgi:hypothetical protein